MTNNAGYLRVSTEGQVDQYGLEAQRNDIIEYAARKRIKINTWYTDRGITGATIDRPGLQKLLKAVKDGSIDKVFVAKMDRVARDLYIQLFIEKELKVSDVEIITVSEPINGKDPMNIAFRQLMGVFAELEKSTISLRLAGGRKQKARGGGYAGGKPPLGYQAERGSKVLEIDPEKAQTVRRIFELAAELDTLQAIADRLKAEGHTTAQDAVFNPVQVKRVLDREHIYKGRYAYAGIEVPGLQKAII